MKVIYGVEAYLAPDKNAIVTDAKGQSIDTTYYNIYDESEAREDTAVSVEITGGTIYSKPVNHTYYWDSDSTMYEVYCVNRQHIDMNGGYIYSTGNTSDYTTNGIYMDAGKPFPLPLS